MEFLNNERLTFLIPVFVSMAFAAGFQHIGPVFVGIAAGLFLVRAIERA